MPPPGGIVLKMSRKKRRPSTTIDNQPKDWSII